MVEDHIYVITMTETNYYCTFIFIDLIIYSIVLQYLNINCNDIYI